MGVPRPVKRGNLEHFTVRIVPWQYDVLAKRALARGVGMGEVLRSILEQALASERDTPVPQA